MIDDSLIPFLPKNQLAIIRECLDGEEREFFIKKMNEIKAVIQAMPVTYEQSELGDEAVAHLHYFYGKCHWYITEKMLKVMERSKHTEWQIWVTVPSVATSASWRSFNRVFTLNSIFTGNPRSCQK